MYTVSQGFTNAIESAGRRIYTKAVFNGTRTLTGDGTDGAIVDFTITEVMDEGNVSMGCTPSSSVEMTIRTPSLPISLRNGTVVPYIGINNGTAVEYVPMGTFVITEVTSSTGGEILTIRGYDRMSLLEGEYIPTVSFPCTSDDILQDISTQAGILMTYTASEFDAVVNEAREGTYREWIGWMAGLSGKSARFNRNGVLTFKFYDTSVYDLVIGADLQYASETNADNDNISLSAIRSGVEGDIIESGNGNAIIFTNPFMTQERLDSIRASVGSFNFKPLTCKWRGNPALEVGDVVAVDIKGTQYPALVMSHIISVSGGLSDTITCAGEGETERVISKSPTQAKLQSVYNSLMQAVSEATGLINGARGGIFEVTDSDGDGVNDGWKIKQSSDPTVQGKCIVANYEGIGFSQDGGQTYGTAITTDGVINADYITAGHLDAQRIFVGDEQLLNYFYVGHRKEGDTSTPVCIRLAVSSMTIEIIGNRISFYESADVSAYQQGQIDAETYTSRSLAYWDNDEFVLNSLKQMRLGTTLIQARSNGSISFIGA